VEDSRRIRHRSSCFAAKHSSVFSFDERSLVQNDRNVLDDILLSSIATYIYYRSDFNSELCKRVVRGKFVSHLRPQYRLVCHLPSFIISTKFYHHNFDKSLVAIRHDKSCLPTPYLAQLSTTSRQSLPIINNN